MVNASFDLEKRHHGTTVTNGRPAIMPKTRTNLVSLTDSLCPSCLHPVIDSDCFCTLFEGIEKPVVRNKKGEAYEVVWVSRHEARILHPGDLEYYTVEVDEIVERSCNFTCYNRSDFNAITGQGKCWPFSNKSSCVHCDAVENSILLGERPTVAPKPQPATVAPKRQCWHDGGDCTETSVCCTGGYAPTPRVLGPAVEQAVPCDLVAMFDGGPVTPAMRRAERALEKKTA